jgi:alanine racemase
VDYTLLQIAEICGGTFRGSDAPVSRFITDSRRYLRQSNVCFVALPGRSSDGHRFIPELYEQGVRAFLVSKVPDGAFPEAGFVVVDDVLAALQTLAADKRKRFRGTVIGITGSNGKTIVKEWLHHLLVPGLHVFRSPKSWNSQLGVPLSVLMMSDEDDIAIIEAGISRPGEMARLQTIIDPHVGVFTNLGSAHDEGFAGLEEKGREKALLFGHSRAVICDENQHDVVRLAGSKALTFGNSGTLRIVSQTAEPDGISFQMEYGGSAFRWFLPFTQPASVQNALLAATTALELGVAPQVIATRLATLQPLALRHEVLPGKNGSLIINDAWHSDPSGLEFTLDLARQQGAGMPLCAILTDISVPDARKARVWQHVMALLNHYHVERVMVIGADAATLPGASAYYPSTEDFLAQLQPGDFGKQCVILKGARHFHLEKIAVALQEKTHQTRLQIDLNAAARNIRNLRQHLQPGVKLMAMLKAFGYGTGASELARLLAWEQVDYIGVAYADEGVQLRQAGVALPIMVMDPEEAVFDAIVAHNLQPALFSLRILDQFIAYLVRQDMSGYPVHMEINTGMNRLGIDIAELDQLIDVLQSQPEIWIVSVFSHLASSEDVSEDAFTRLQIERLNNASAAIQRGLGYPVMRHILNSAGIIRHPEGQFDMVRSGIGLYGDGPSAEGAVVRFVTGISQIRTVAAGERVGYNGTWTAERDSTIAVLPVGYADGLRRSLSNGRGWVSINGRRYPIAGRVCMDLTMIDIRGGAVSETDEVEIFGNDIPLSEFAEWCETIPYEVLTSISQRVKRVYVGE